MPYILKTSQKQIFVADATVDKSTSLTFVGQNFSGYGEPIEQNFVRLLENFSGPQSPVNPIQGQVWFDNTTSTSQLKIFYDPSANYSKGIASLTIGNTSTVDIPVTGDMIWDPSARSLQLYDETIGDFVKIGPYDGVGNDTNWLYPSVTHDDDFATPAIIGTVGNTPLVAVSAAIKYALKSTSDYFSSFPAIQKGITLQGADSFTGSSRGSGYYFWGTAAESLSSVESQLSETTTFDNCFVPFASTATGTTPLVTTSTFYFNPGTGVLNATATSAYYADLAERYESDFPYEAGTVLVIGGEKEVTVTDVEGDTRVAGIVSRDPAYRMNCDAGPDETHPYIALKGRVFCKVHGKIEKGDLLVTSAEPGYAMAYSSIHDSNAVIGKALGKNDGGFGLIEVLVV